MSDSQRIYGRPGFCIVKEIDRLPKEIVSQLAEFDTSILGDGMGHRGIMDAAIKALDPAFRMCGSAITVDTRIGDNLMVHTALKIAQPGDVLVVNAHGDVSTSYWGELTSRMSIRKGLAGLVLDGSVRDSRDLVAAGFPVFCRGVCPCGGSKEGPGEVNLPITCGGLVVNPGDIVAGDADGVAVVPREIAKHAIGWAQQRVEAEKKRFAAIAGEDPEAIYPTWLIPTLRAKGLLDEDETL